MATADGSDTTAPRHATEREARQVAEAAREQDWTHGSYARGLFEGKVRLDLLRNLPRPPEEERARAREFLARLEEFARARIDGDRIDREGDVSEEVLAGLAELGAFGIKIPREYGGLGFDQTTYNRALEIVSSRCGSTGAYLSAHQSIGVPQPLLLFGTEEQKERFLPRLASGQISAFALTEPDVGSDPANVATTATPVDDGAAWLLNGRKLWCTNGPRADLMVVMARTPPPEGKTRGGITAFIVEADSPGIAVEHRCRFMGLHGISNGLMSFRDVRVPSENILWGVGKGLKLALITLNTGRLSLPAFCAASGKLGLEASRDWASTRVQWGVPIGKHDAVAQMVGGMAADVLAMESVVELTSAMADAKTLDIRLEAAIAKLWNTETAWQVANDALQIRGGRGYETAASLRARGETPWPIERMVRDLRINLIFEGTSEIMRLFIAREAVDLHLTVAGDLVDPGASTGRKMMALLKAGVFYAWWYPTRWLGWSRWPRYREFGPLARHLRWIERASRRLARSTFYQMIRFGPKLERRQAVLGRLVDVGAELFMMSATILRAHERARAGTGDDTPIEVADLFCRRARLRVAASFRGLWRNEDTRTYRAAQRAMAGDFQWLEEGVVSFASSLATPAPGPDTARPPIVEDEPVDQARATVSRN